MKKIVVDTNAYSALMKGDIIVKEIIENAQEVIVPVFVMAELYYGFRNGSKEEFNKTLFGNFLNLGRHPTSTNNNRNSRNICYD